MKTLNFAATCVIILLLGCHAVFAQPANSPPDADTAWKELLQATNRPPPPKEWKNHKPTEEQLRRYFQHNIDAALVAAGKAKAFYTQFPDSTNAATAKILEAKMSRRTIVFDRLLHKLNAVVGKPLDITFAAVDGRTVDLNRMKGKVVLIDYWATWCPGCVAEIPHIKEIYDKYHTQGLEVVGISFDTDEKAMNNFTQQHDLPWPQYFDGQGWTNKFGVEYGLEQIPTLWLLDKKGTLRETEASDGLQDKVEKLLLE
ncbi:MAG TPA: TlpA disulfide reductase family protein [Candidatus Acidoferrales bacterium]|jgi:peroxiredoxin|nr:TlpA disulfide reductase family protein [Candidatus Acidoferrales bacterium]